jgi:Domain of unknown function (DUF4124)
MTDPFKTCLVLGVALTLAPGTLDAEVYRWVDELGNIVYSDRPRQPEEARAPSPQVAPSQELKEPETKSGPAPKEHDVKAFVPPVGSARTGPTKVDEFLELSGARAQLVGLLRGIAGELRPAPGKMSAKDQAAVDKVLTRALRHETVYSLVRDAFLPHVDRANLETTAAWLWSPLGRKIVALEIATSEPGFEQKVAEYGTALKAKPPTNHRIELIQRLDWATAATEISADLIAAVARGVTIAVSAAGPAEQRLRPGQIEDRVAQVRARASQRLRDAHTTSTLYAYRDLTDDELGAYVLFSASEAGRWYSAAMRKATVSALGRAVEQTATEMVRAVPLERWAHAATPAPQQVK